jgi:glycosyltransferase involved in cell wall biosynthesis
MDFLPKEVQLLSLPDTYKQFSLPFLQSIKTLLFNSNLQLMLNRVMFSVRNTHRRGSSVTEQYSWRYISSALKHLDKKYDVAIGFLEKTSTYFCVDKVNAARKIGWVHIDYDKLGMDPDFDFYYFDQLDHIVTVSEECAHILKKRFPEQRNKINTIYNIVSPKVINQMVEQENDEVYNRSGDEIIILSIGRLHTQKGFETAIEACAKLVAQNYNVRWHVIGEGDEREKLTALIHKHRLENHFFLLGLRPNPYPYIKQSDIYAQPSKFEGKSIAIDEAKILNKPIVVTNFSTARDQIEDGINGLIVDMDADAVAAGIMRLIDDAELRNRLIHHLSNENFGTEEEINKLYELVGG